MPGATVEDTSVGECVDSLGTKMQLDEGDLPAGCVVLMKVVEPDGDVRLGVSWSEGMSWIERRGMIEAALDNERITPDDTVD